MLTNNMHIIFNEIIDPTVYTNLFPGHVLEHIDPRNQVDNLVNANISSHKTNLTGGIDDNDIENIQRQLNELENPNLEPLEDTPQNNWYWAVGAGLIFILGACAVAIKSTSTGV